MVDALSIVVGVGIGAASTIVGYEYQRWRERSTKVGEQKGKVRESLRSELTKFLSGWQLFKGTQNMQGEGGLAQYRFELKLSGHAILDILSRSQNMLSADLIDKGMRISGDVVKMSLWQFYIDGGKSFNELVKFGDDTAKRCEELAKKLR